MLEEESVTDHAFGRFVTHNLADYHVPVNTDMHDIEVIFVQEQDEAGNVLGAKGLGEIGTVGVAAVLPSKRNLEVSGVNLSFYNL